jgi:hypothetical protein
MSDVTVEQHNTDPAAAAEIVLDRLEKPIADIRDAVASIERAIYGEARSGYVGLVERVGVEEKARAVADESIRKEIQEFRESFAALEKRFDRMIWIALGVGLGSGAGASWVVQSLSGG